MKILVEHYYHALIFESEVEARGVIASIETMIKHKKENGSPYPGMSIKVCSNFKSKNGKEVDPIKSADYQTDRVLAGLRLDPKDVKKSDSTKPIKSPQ